MKTTVACLISVLLGASAYAIEKTSLVESGATESNEQVIFSYKDIETAPVVIEGSLPHSWKPSDEGRTFLTFVAVVVDATGKVIRAEPVQATDTAVASEIVVHLKNWKLSPAAYKEKAVACAAIIAIRCEVGGPITNNNLNGHMTTTYSDTYSYTISGTKS